MKIYFEVKIRIKPGDESADIIIAKLSGFGFDGFVEESEHILAYCEVKDWSAAALQEFLEANGIRSASISEIEDENWNANWESGYDPVMVADRVMVRAPFHDPVEGIEHDIIIEPRMSFGTAHHETTSLMLELILSIDIKGEDVLDMGSGTAVLAILAFRKGADSVVAIDNDVWAWQNAIDNVKMNEANAIEVEMGDAGIIGTRRFNIIFANINRNILLKDIPAYAEALLVGGKLLLSGFYEDDLTLIQGKCMSEGLRMDELRVKNRWAAAVFTKDQADDKD